MEATVFLHYAKIDNNEDIPYEVFDDLNELISFILADASFDVVHLICIDDNVFVSHDIAQICRFVNMYEDYLKDGVDVYWQEYDSYQSAYAVGLSMQEQTGLCYTEK